MSNFNIWQRIFGAVVVGILISATINEVTFRFIKRIQDRPPGIVELSIPNGTAALVAKGKNPEGVPDNLVLVAGDTLVVHNNDVSNHQLGPLFIPAKHSATLSLDSVANYAYTCSFRSDRYLGLEINEPLTFTTRLIGTLFSGLPFSILIVLYSIVLSPLPKKINNV